MRESTTCVVAIDLGDKWSVVGGFDRRTGEVIRHQRVRTTPAAVEELLGALPPKSRVVVETGTHSNWVARVAERLGHEPVIAQSRKTKAIWGNSRKSDDQDVDLLWRIAHVEPDLLSPVRYRKAETHAHLCVVRAREQAVEARTKLVNATRGLVKSLGHQLPTCSTEAFHKIPLGELPMEVAPIVAPMLEAAGALTEAIRKYDREVTRLCKQVYGKQTRRLLEIAGVGDLTALTFVLVVEDPALFRRSRDVGAYVGLVPRRDQSSDRERQLPISKEGDRLLRRLLDQCAHFILGPFGPDTDLRRWGLKLAERGGKIGKSRAVVAVARKLAVLMLRLWATDQAYEPLREANRARVG